MLGSLSYLNNYEKTNVSQETQ